MTRNSSKFIGPVFSTPWKSIANGYNEDSNDNENYDNKDNDDNKVDDDDDYDDDDDDDDNINNIELTSLKREGKNNKQWEII